MAAALLLRGYVEWIGPFPGDRWAHDLHDRIWDLAPTWYLDLQTLFSVIGTPVVAGLIVATGAWFARRSEGTIGAAFVLLAGAGVVANSALKRLSGPTPLQDNPGLNFPSGHVVFAVVAFGALAIVAFRAGRRDAGWLLVALAVAMGPFRISATHLLSDVIAGYLVGLAWLLLVATATLQRPR